MTDDTLSPLVGTIPEADIRHREVFWEFVLSKADPAYRKPLTRLLHAWEAANTRFYDGVLVAPIILLATPSNPRRYGDCGDVSGWGAKSQIRIRHSLLTGTHPHMRAGTKDPEGLFRFVADVLLHEMIHQWQHEITHKTEGNYHGHGPTFCAKANEIGKQLRLPPVIVKKRPGHREEPVCPQWPHNVRPPDHYLGAYVPTSGDGTMAEDEEGASSLLDLFRGYLELHGYTVIAPGEQ